MDSSILGTKSKYYVRVNVAARPADCEAVSNFTLQTDGRWCGVKALRQCRATLCYTSAVCKCGVKALRQCRATLCYTSAVCKCGVKSLRQCRATLCYTSAVCKCGVKALRQCRATFCYTSAVCKCGVKSLRQCRATLCYTSAVCKCPNPAWEVNQLLTVKVLFFQGKFILYQAIRMELVLIISKQ
jgi:hypothetical protein